MARNLKNSQVKVNEALSKLQEAEYAKTKSQQEAQEAILLAETELTNAKAAEEQAHLDEIANLEAVRTHITEFCKNEGFFCGVILTREAILQIVNLAMESHDDQIKIPFQLYSTD
ncbi:MAG: hypothetical protein WCI92_16770 [Bacteroidota bacterium]|jgi:hypothetical protein